MTDYYENFGYTREHFPYIEFMNLEQVKNIPTINTHKQLLELKEKLKVRNDWHEPDEQDVTVRMVGWKLDNAFCEPHSGEITVIVCQDGKPVAAINLAILLAYATGYRD